MRINSHPEILALTCTYIITPKYVNLQTEIKHVLHWNRGLVALFLWTKSLLWPIRGQKEDTEEEKVGETGVLNK